MQFAYHFISTARNKIYKNDLSPAALSFSTSGGAGDGSSLSLLQILCVYLRRDYCILMNSAYTEE